MQVTIALSLIHALYSSLQHALRLFSRLCLHRLSPGNGDQRRRFLSFRVPRLRYSLGGAYLTSQLGVARLQSPSKSCSLRSYGSRTVFPNRWLQTILLCPCGFLDKAQDLLSETFNHWLLDSALRSNASINGDSSVSHGSARWLSQIRTVSELKFMLWLTVSRPGIVGVEPRLGPKTRFLLPKVKVRVTLRVAVYRLSILVPSLLRLTARDFIFSTEPPAVVVLM
jgi:hypothetical protein